MQGLCHSWEGQQEGSILRDQRHAQVLGGAYKLTVVGAAAAGAHQLRLQPEPSSGPAGANRPPRWCQQRSKPSLPLEGIDLVGVKALGAEAFAQCPDLRRALPPGTHDRVVEVVAASRAWRASRRFLRVSVLAMAASHSVAIPPFWNRFGLAVFIADPPDDVAAPDTGVLCGDLAWRALATVMELEPRSAQPALTPQPRLLDRQGWSTLLAGALLLLISFITNYGDDHLSRFRTLPAHEQGLF